MKLAITRKDFRKNRMEMQKEFACKLFFTRREYEIRINWGTNATSGQIYN